MTDKQIIIDGVDVSGCQHFCKDDPCKNTCQYFCTPCEWVEIQNCMYKYAKRKEQECEKAKQNAQDTYDLWQALIESFNVLQGEKIKLEQECEELKEKYASLEKNNLEEHANWCDTKWSIQWRNIALIEENKKLKQTLAEVIRFFKEDEKFARYSGCPVVLTKTALEKIEKILKENDIKINEVDNDRN